ncbi:MAG: hypothetical protein HKO92_01820 [Flavobacteriaceae bacterium]|nr:hypothetical protein [Flavobacteriaceae bacterium]
MKTLSQLVILILVITVFNCESKKQTSKSVSDDIKTTIDTTIYGEWIRMSPQGPVKIHFLENGSLEIDLSNDKSIDIISNFKIENDTINFFDKEGKTCPNNGIYKVYHRGYSIAFDVLDDLCNGRIKTTSGFWVRPNHNELIKELNSKIKNSNDISYTLHRGRMFLALGQNKKARKDFDTYMKSDSTNAKVFIHRAATRFPNGFKGIVNDCSKAIAIDSTEKYAYFLRGLAKYELGEKQEACNDFQKAIDLGFEILKEAEAYKCRAYW